MSIISSINDKDGIRSNLIELLNILDADELECCIVAYERKDMGSITHYKWVMTCTSLVC